MMFMTPIPPTSNEIPEMRIITKKTAPVSWL